MIGCLYALAALSLIGSTAAALATPVGNVGLVTWAGAGLVGFVAFLWMARTLAALRRKAAQDAAGHRPRRCRFPPVTDRGLGGNLPCR